MCCEICEKYCERCYETYIVRDVVRGVMRGDRPGEKREEVAAGMELHHQVETLTVLERVVQLCDPLAV